MPGIVPGRSNKYMITGATGFLGSHIMAGLLIKGKSVAVAGRPSAGNPLKARIQKLLAWFGIERLESRLEYHETDFLKPRMGLESNEYYGLAGSLTGIIHCASDTGFAEKNRAGIMKSNVESLDEILNLACTGGISCFHFMSTAYAAGIGSIECAEDQVSPVHFNNVYEESKSLAEKIVLERCRKLGIPFTIIRPSIVYGDSVTGRSLRFNALYYPVRSLLLIRDIYIKDIKNNNGINSLKYGIYINDKGELNLPIRIFAPGEGKINLIPVDYLTSAVLSILENNSGKTFFNITCRNPESLTKLVSYAGRFLGITGVEVVTDTQGAEEMRNPPEELFDHFIRAYRPYFSDKRVFVTENTDSITRGIRLPEFNYEVFERCMAFAVSVDWGKSIFNRSV